MIFDTFHYIRPYLQHKLTNNTVIVNVVASLWFLSLHIINKACISWRQALGKMWRLSPMTHCDVMTLLSDCIPPNVSFQFRFVNP